MSRFLLIFAAVVASVAGVAQAAAPAEKPVFAVVVTRHGVRAISKAPSQYVWADWTPLAPDTLTAHGYRLASYMGQFYRWYFTREGLAPRCRRQGTFVYADIAERTLETGHALIEGMCGMHSALAMYHEANRKPKVADPLFNAAAWAKSLGRINAKAALASVRSAAANMAAPDFAGLQQLLDARCAGTCAAVTSEPTAIAMRGGLPELTGPVKTASTYAEDLFLEYAQCRPDVEFAGSQAVNIQDDLESAMRLHVLAYDVNSRNPYSARVRGGTLFAHIVGMLEQKAGTSDTNVRNPDMKRYSLAFFSGHDTQIGALGGILGAHWKLSNGLVPDDMPPGGGLIFELYKTRAGAYRVRLKFAYQTLAQYRNYAYLPQGVGIVPVRFKGCSGKDCSVSLERMASLANAIAKEGLVRKAWTPYTYAPVKFAPLRNPVWTRCAG